jgi:hypothetical protein
MKRFVYISPFIITAVMHMQGSENGAFDRSDRRKIEEAEMRFSRRLSGHASVAPVSSALQTCGLERRLQDYKNK